MHVPEQRDGLINVLMAEDNEADAKLSQRAFKKSILKTNLFIVDDGQEAVEFVNNQGQFADAKEYPRPDVMLLDINMPRLDGLQALENIKNNVKTRDIPCVILTSSKNEEDIVKGYGLGCSSYIPKPVDYADFKRIIECFNFYWVAMNSKPSYASEDALNTKILIVDDEEVDAKLMRGMMAKNGYQNISCVRTGEEALEMAHNEKFDIIVLDIMLPGMDGIATCRNLRAIDGFESKVILVTGDKSCVNVIREGDCGAVEYLVKSSDYSTLLQAIRTLVQ